MNGNDIDRRSFLKVMGWGGAGVALAGCDMPTTVTLEEGKETVVSYLMPEEYVIPGRGVWYASTCQQCPSGCGIHARVREGRVLKIEGNPSSPVNKGGLCMMGQASVQSHYNPDRITKPMMRSGGSLVEVSWDDALAALKTKTGEGAEGSKVAWLTGTVSGHQRVLLDGHLDALGTDKHFSYEVINGAVVRAAAKAVYGDEQPEYDMANASVVLSIGSDLLGASDSPMNYSRQYAEFRNAPRGTLVQVESSMSLTGGSADRWLAVRPGTEGTLAMGLANLLLSKHGKDGSGLSAATKAAISSFTVDVVVKETEMQAADVESLAQLLADKGANSLVVVGGVATGYSHGYQTAVASMLLNVILGSVGKTVKSAGGFPFEQLSAQAGSTGGLFEFTDSANKGDIDVVFVYGTNPVFTAPTSTGFADSFAKVPYKVVLSQFEDETTVLADLVLPLASGLEEWGTHVAAHQTAEKSISIQQPVMEKLYKETKGFGDVLLDLLKIRNEADFGKFDDYYAYLVSAFGALPADFKGGADDKTFWQNALSSGVVAVEASKADLSVAKVDVKVASYAKDASRPYNLTASARLGLWDGRYANIPWLQEAPDVISKAVWGSWVEMHPITANRLGVKTGDFVKVESEHGSIEVPVYAHRGVHPDAMAVPMGQGHKEYGRFAKGVGVNPLSILANAKDEQTGELALSSTRVNVSKVSFNEEDKMVRFGGSESQVGRKLVASIKADVFNRTEGA